MACDCWLDLYDVLGAGWLALHDKDSDRGADISTIAADTFEIIRLEHLQELQRRAGSRESNCSALTLELYKAEVDKLMVLNRRPDMALVNATHEAFLRLFSLAAFLMEL